MSGCCEEPDRGSCGAHTVNEGRLPVVGQFDYGR
jgi:hypothetical protein